jgi:hypothetical protein
MRPLFPKKFLRVSNEVRWLWQKKKMDLKTAANFAFDQADRI